MVNLSYAQMLLGIYRNLDARAQYFVDDVIRNLPVIGGIARASDSISYYDDYLKNIDKGYDYIKYHKANLGFGSATMGVTNFVSDNIKTLYNKKK